jgi:ubiquinone/menaquinone biosynthesis C-methylase UbiE
METASPLPPPFTDAHRHGVSPDPRHDEIARFNFLGTLNQHVATRVFPGNRVTYEARARPAFEHDHGRPPETRREVGEAMRHEPYYQFWSALRRTNQEMRQENGRAMVLRQLHDLIDRAQGFNQDAPTLKLDANVEIPRYLSGVDTHCMPGSYYTEIAPDDVAAGANYDLGLFISTGGLIGPWIDGAGRAMLAWLRREAPDFAPRRILDLGTGVGHNILPFARAFPQAEVVAVDVAAPMLRYGHARAQSLGITNVTFLQANAEDTGLPAGSFDLVLTAMFWHETSAAALPRIMREIHRLQASGGLNLSLEQPPYRGMPAYDAFIRDWDSHYNNEPFWGTLHDMSMLDQLAAAGFDRAACFETTFEAVLEQKLETGMDKGKDFGRGGTWYGFGAWSR